MIKLRLNFNLTHVFPKTTSFFIMGFGISFSNDMIDFILFPFIEKLELTTLTMVVFTFTIHCI